MMKNFFEVNQMYDNQALKWARNCPKSLSDYTCRPIIFETCGNLSGKDVLDLGCGEGYCTREFKRLGANYVMGVDLSRKMIEQAKSQEERDQLDIDYRCLNALDISAVDKSFDVIVSVFMFNYMPINEMLTTLKNTRRLLNEGGSLIFSVPHPSFPFINQKKYPFYFDRENNTYFSAVDKKMDGQIHCVDGESLDVTYFHKTVSDYFTALSMAGFSKLPTLKELTVTEELVNLNKAFFSSLTDVPLHMVIKIDK